MSPELSDALDHITAAVERLADRLAALADRLAALEQRPTPSSAQLVSAGLERSRTLHPAST